MLFLHRKLRLTTSGRWNYGLSLNNTLSLPMVLNELCSPKTSEVVTIFLFLRGSPVYECSKTSTVRVVEEKNGDCEFSVVSQ